MKPGIFFEEWELLTEPLLIQQLPLINLTGIATKEDDRIQAREEHLKYREEAVRDQIVKETLE